MLQQLCCCHAGQYRQSRSCEIQLLQVASQIELLLHRCHKLHTQVGTRGTDLAECDSVPSSPPAIQPCAPDSCNPWTGTESRLLHSRYTCPLCTDKMHRHATQWCHPHTMDDKTVCFSPVDCRTEAQNHCCKHIDCHAAAMPVRSPLCTPLVRSAASGDTVAESW